MADPHLRPGAKDQGRSAERCSLEASSHAIARHSCQLSSSAAGTGLSAECPQDGAALGVAQLGAAATAAGAGPASGDGAAGLDAAGFRAAFFFAGLLLAAAFFADFFGAADFLADLLADLPALFAVFLADFFEDFFADFFLAATTFFLAFLAFLPAFFFLPLAIVILLLPPTNIYRAFQHVASHTGPWINLSWPGTACRPIEKL